MSKSASSSRLIRTRRLRLNAAVTPRASLHGGAQGRRILAQIRADDQSGSGAEVGRDSGEKALRLFGREVADGRSGKKAETIAAARGRQFERSGVVGADRHDPDMRVIGRQNPGGSDQLSATDVDRNEGRGRTQRVEQQSDLFRCAGAEFDQHRSGARRFRHLGRVPFQQRDFGARRVILRKFGDLLEQAGARVVVEILRRQGLLRHRKSGLHVGEKILLFVRIFDETGERRRGKVVGRHGKGYRASLAMRRPANVQRM